MSEGTETGTFVGRYEIVGSAGEGAMANVFRAYDPEIDRTVAIKIIKDDLRVDEEYLNRFLREAKAAGALSHPNIVTIFDVGKVEDRPYITMEYLEGDTLGDLMEAGKPLELKQIITTAIDIANALDYAHRKGVVHRDIKPGNILFAPGSNAAKIADFGIARMDGSDELHQTQAGMVLGTPRYMSPEQALGSVTDGRTDLYSVGVILYELLGGQKAFDASTMTTLLLQITQEDPVPLKKIAPDVPLGMRRIVSKLLDKRPEKRFQTGAELSAALSRELAAVIEQEEERQRNKYIPLKIKWAAGMGAMVAIVLLVSMTTVFRIQAREITGQAIDSGSSLAKFAATEAAIPVLSEDWITLETFVSEASERETFQYLVVADHGGTIRAATDKLQIGQPYVPASDAEFVAERDDIVVSQVESGNGAAVFNFDTPILFQRTEVGRIYLGLSRQGLDDVMSTTRLLMILLGIVTIASVVGMLYVFGGLLIRPIGVLKRSMLDLGAGDLDHRISMVRNDEIGDLFSAFNRMADMLQKERGKVDVSEVAEATEAAEAPSSHEVPEKEPMTSPKSKSPPDLGDATVIAGSVVDGEAAGSQDTEATTVLKPRDSTDDGNATVIAPSKTK